ncbi:MAG TPA: PAS domain S-box protein [Flavitalea sp.]|nr:PAS domain S-box protein [Flavitalea sp.]
MKERNEKELMQLTESNEKLRKSEDRYFKMIDEVEDYAIILLDVNGIVLNWNKGAQKIKQYQQHEIIGRHFSTFYLPEDQAANLPAHLLKQAENTGKAAHEGWRVRKDGTRFWGSITLTALHGENDQIIGFSKVTRDLTERKMGEDQLKQFAFELQEKNEALRASEERYHKMVDEVQDYAIIFLDKEGIIQNWNKGAQKIKQYEESEVVGKHFRMFYLQEDKTGKLPEILLEQANVHGRALHEGWRVRKDRTRFWGSITLTAIHNDNNELIGFTKVTRDLTEKKLAEDQLKNFTAELQLSNEALRKSEERYHKMIAEVQDYAIILLDVNGDIQNWNAGAEKIKGYSAQEIVGKNFQIFYTEEDTRTNLPQKLLMQAKTAGRAIHEGWRVTKRGSKFWGSIVITALHGDDGDIIGYSKVTRDLTEKKQTEDRLNQYLHELQKQNEELDRFAYVASHDLREPLRKIQTFADLIEQHTGNQEMISKYLEKINIASTRMSDLIGSILEYSRHGKTTSEKVYTDLNNILTDVLVDFELLIQQKKAVIQFDKLPAIKIIPLQINQLFANLIGNSLKYTGQNPLIRISCSVVSGKTVSQCNEPLGEGSYYQLIFTDNGIGFEQEYAQHIFTLFQRLHPKHEYSGAGIGLALCKKIIENHEGCIFAEGNPGKGASFYVYFPVE